MNTVLRSGIACIALLTCLSCGEDAGQTSSDLARNGLQLKVLPGRTNHTSVWTGSKMIVFGGFTKGSGSTASGTFQGDYATPNDVMEYDPASDSWRLIKTIGTSLSGHSAMWTGSEMVVWGGLTMGASGSPSATNAGVRYDPASDTWSAMSTTNAPAPRAGHTAVWTGPVSAQTATALAVMVIWGGSPTSNAVDSLADGARYDPAADTWSPISSINAPSPRSGYSAVWTGKEMILWGGLEHDRNGNPSVVKTGARYDPIADTWSAMTITGAPYARQNHIAVWTGTEMLIVGGFNLDQHGYPLIDGARYDPATDTWKRIAYLDHYYYDRSIGCAWTGVWTGVKLIVFLDPYESMYDPATDTWEEIGKAFLPPGKFRWSSTALWDGTEMILWGGQNRNGDLYNTGFRYNPEAAQWAWTTLLEQ
jgi:N-acetylneuraminic acid mutarotase